MLIPGNLAGHCFSCQVELHKTSYMLASFTFFMTIDVIKVIYHYHMARMIIVTANILFGIVKISYNCQQFKPCTTLPAPSNITNNFRKVTKSIAFKSLARGGWLGPLRTPINAPTLQNIIKTLQYTTSSNHTGNHQTK